MSAVAAAQVPGAAGEWPAAALDVRGLSVSYGAVRAVDDVTFSAAPGSIVGLIGPNGAGKTTVFDAICGITSLSSGQVVLDGRDVTKMNPSERARAGLGRSFQDAKLFGSLTVYETLACAYERHIRAQDAVSTALGMPWVRRIERRVARQVDELIERMGLGAFRDKFVSELSTGSRRIVDLACVLAHDPFVVLLDEPSSGIAQKETEVLAPLLVSVKEHTGCTMLLIEHDMPLVTAVSDQLIALEVGRIIATGTPTEVTNHPAVVKAYLGTDQRAIARSGALGEDGRGNARKAAAAKRRDVENRDVERKTPTRKKAAAKKKAPAKKKAAAGTAKKKAPAKKVTAGAAKKRAGTATKKAGAKAAGRAKGTAKKSAAAKKRSTGRAAAGPAPRKDPRGRGGTSTRG